MGKPIALFLSNYTAEYVISARARYFAEAISDVYKPVVVYREGPKEEALRQFLAAAWQMAPHFIYVMEVGFIGGLVALLAKLSRGVPYIADTAGTAMDGLRASRQPRWRWQAADWVERRIYGHAAGVAVRGLLQKIIFEARYYNDRVYYLPESVDTERWCPKERPDLRAALGLDGCLTVGVMGTLAWSDALDWGYGKELVEMLHLLRDEPVKGVIIPVRSSHGGSQHGEAKLRELIARRGLDDRVVFIRDVPREAVPDYLSVVDVCLSTQTADPVGEMRTSAKLPDYLACGKFVLATRVGTARFVLPEEMLLDYRGRYDPHYPQRLAERVRWILAHRDALALGSRGVAIAKEHFEFRKVAQAAREMILECIPAPGTV
ncbi:MAG: glycosyltransferase [Chloroflexi bacterium]|nr:glycosyltransferase [Chloroflexota bacterium]MBI4506380.1 glycosyltransferase [Chloroflexota bacterium]